MKVGDFNDVIVIFVKLDLRTGSYLVDAELSYLSL